MNLMQVALVHVGRQEHVDRLRLTDIGRAVGRVLDHPALVEFERSVEDRLLVIR